MLALLFLFHGCQARPDLPARPDLGAVPPAILLNGHNWLARKLAAAGIGYTMADNVFVRIDDWPHAEVLADSLAPEQLHRALDRYATLCCPVAEVFGQDYHWSLMQVEYATDPAFRSTATLGPLYEQLVRQSVLDVKAEHVASFLGR